MPDSGKADVYFELNAPVLPDALRAELGTQAQSEIDALVSASTRQGWLNVPYSGSPTPQGLHNHARELVQAANPSLVLSGDTSRFFYCWSGSSRICYFIQSLAVGGSSVSVSATAGGLSVTVPVYLIASTVG